MKKVMSLILGVLLVLGLAGCSRVPQEKLDAVVENQTQMEEKSARLLEVLKEMDSVSQDMGLDSMLPDDMSELEGGLNEVIERRNGIIENDLKRMKEEDVDAILAKQDKELGVLDTWVPALEEMLASMENMVALNGEIEAKMLTISVSMETATFTPDLMEAIMNLQMLVSEAESYTSNIDEIEMPTEEELDAAEDEDAVYAMLDKIDVQALLDAVQQGEKLLEDLNGQLDNLIAVLDGETAQAA